MKNRYIFLLIISLLFFACRKDKSVKGICLQGKLIRITCASAVIQVLNDDSKGVDRWIDLMGGNNTSYDNVFTVSNKCQLPSTMKPGDTFWFIMVSSNANNCIFCDMLDSPPPISFDVLNISGIPCTN